MTHLLILTTKETFEYNPVTVKRVFSMQWRAYASHTVAERERRSLPALTEEQMFENWIIEQFEMHNGSIFGDGLFSQIDIDCGSELVTRADDE